LDLAKYNLPITRQNPIFFIVLANYNLSIIRQNLVSQAGFEYKTDKNGTYYWKRD
jgi:hypothetical protein